MTELLEYIDQLLALKQQYTQQRILTKNQIETIRISFEQSNIIVATEEQSQIDMIEQMTQLKNVLEGLDYQESQLDSQIQSTRDVIAGMTGGAV